jgi:hypothetical protein
MAETGRVKRQQSRENESHVNTRQDRNIYITDGGLWSWDSGTGTLTWSSSFFLRRAGVPIHTIVAGSVVGVTTNGQVIFVDVSRTAGGTIAIQGGTVPGPLLSINDALHSTDTRLIIGIRGSDGKLYLRDGTVFSDGDVKTLGTLSAFTDRNEVTAPGTALVSVGFDYLFTSGLNAQLTVFVGGILQTLGTHYTETTESPGDVTFIAPHIPPAGDVITFINVVGGQGPSGSGVTLQDAYDNGNEILTASTIAPVIIHRSVGTLLALGVSPSILDWKITLTPSSGILLQDTASLMGYGFLSNDGAHIWRLTPANDGSSDALFFADQGGGVQGGLLVDGAGAGLEWGALTGGYDGGGTWAGAGPIRWSVFTGTLNATGDSVTLATGITSILGVMLSLELVGGSGNFISKEVNNATVADRRHAATFDSSGNVQISESSDGSGDPGGVTTTFNNAAYKLIVFHQG